MIVTIWAIASALILLLFTIAGVLNLRGRANTVRLTAEANLHVAQNELHEKDNLLREIAGLTFGFAPAGALEALEAKLDPAEESVAVERGKNAIAQAELETAQLRLRELEEVARELEASKAEAAQELEMLRSEEQQIAERNAGLKAELDRSLAQLDRLLTELTFSHDAVDYLTTAKGEISEGQQKIEWYSEQISVLNTQYMSLKKAYDALDIEYAQLYEKQSAA
jgi:chromosome segregation ATPase